MEKAVLISICVPAYKRPENIRRLLHSIRIQNFRDIEVIITDDSPDNSVQEVLPEFADLPIKYFQNRPSLGTPANWNSGIARANGTWIKIIHDDDWLHNEHSLQSFADATRAGRKFIFSNYQNVWASGKVEQKYFPALWRKKIIHNPVSLLAYNVIGPPSVVMVHRSIEDRYDERLKWRVDMEFYIRLLQKEKEYTAIPETLINVGISESQVTNSCINMPEVELPEGHLLLEKYGLCPLKDVVVYDAWWRILRNVGVRSTLQLHQHTPGKSWPLAIENMVRHQSRISAKGLKNGVVSKLAMLASYVQNYKNLGAR